MSTAQNMNNNAQVIPNAISGQALLLLRGLNQFRHERVYTDVVLCANEEEFQCHKVVLAASSRYFHAMFMSPFSEQTTSRVYLKQISPWALKKLIDFSYTGALELSPSCVQDVFVAANLLDYPLAIGACTQFMEQHLDITNCLGVQLLAETYNFLQLADISRRMALDNFTRLIQESTEWVSLSAESVSAYLESDELDVRCEEVVLDACLKWVLNDPETRVFYLVDLLSHVRLHLIPKQALFHAINNCSVLKDYIPASLYIQGFLGNNEFPTNASSVSCQLKLPRPASLKRETLVAVGGINSDILDTLDALSFVKGSWLPCSSLPIDSLAWFSAVVANNTLVITGGIRAGNIVTSVLRYSVETNQWRSGSEMLQPRARHASIVVSGKYIFVFGGLTISRSYRHGSGDEHLSSLADQGSVPKLTLVGAIDRYDVENDHWTTVGFSTTPRQSSSMAVVSESLSTKNADLNGTGDTSYSDPHNFTVLELGGTLDSQASTISDRMAIYHIDADLSVTASEDYIALWQPVRYAQCTVNKGLVYIFWEATSELSVLDFHRQSLRTLKPLTTRMTTNGQDDDVDNRSCGNTSLNASSTRIYCGCTWVKQCMYVLGGFCSIIGDAQRPTGARGDLHCYNPESDSWSEVVVGSPSVPRAVCSCVCLKM